MSRIFQHQNRSRQISRLPLFLFVLLFNIGLLFSGDLTIFAPKAALAGGTPQYEESEKYKKSTGDTCRVDPNDARVLEKPLGKVVAKTVRFTQDSIANKFIEYGTLKETIAELKSGELSPDVFDPIRVFEVNGMIFSLDNRRLFVFQQAELQIMTIPATSEEIINDSFKFTTRNCGKTIRVRRGLK